ncbi:hypothetical protein BAE44_0005996 [Dichanthelium oligosanthes]|uniref:DUF7610 domain-containing protein n=1 Tax=Dichanthelium oligosanthes TaxID=888268 RepID=A0A1E5W6H1_9POAL|nr:hypothetical protein BAE44_0005996 [Dichanthelium oligosanthes]
MDVPPPVQGRRASTVVERKLDELCACLDHALSSRQRRPGAEERFAAEIKAKTDFLRSLLAAEAECHGGARPEQLAEAEARFAVLEATFDQWASRAVATPEPEEEEEEVGEPVEEADCSESSASTCSCTDSCQEAAAGDAVEARKEVTADGSIASKGHDDAECEAAETRGEAALGAVAKKRETMGARDDVKPKDAVGKKKSDADHEAAAETRRTVHRRWWRRGAAWCGAAGVVAVVAVGLAVEFAAVAHHNVNVYVVPT